MHHSCNKVSGVFIHWLRSSPTLHGIIRHAALPGSVAFGWCCVAITSFPERAVRRNPVLGLHPTHARSALGLCAMMMARSEHSFDAQLQRRMAMFVLSCGLLDVFACDAVWRQLHPIQAVPPTLAFRSSHLRSLRFPSPIRALSPVNILN